MNPVDQRGPNEPPSGTARKRSRLLAVVALLAGGAGAYVWWRRPAADLPVFDWSQADPVVVAAVESARAAVRQSPRSGVAWGKLGMTLFANYLIPEAQVCFAQAQRFEPDEPRWETRIEEATRTAIAALTSFGKIGGASKT